WSGPAGTYALGRERRVRNEPPLVRFSARCAFQTPLVERGSGCFWMRRIDAESACKTGQNCECLPMRSFRNMHTTSSHTPIYHENDYRYWAISRATKAVVFGGARARGNNERKAEMASVAAERLMHHMRKFCAAAIRLTLLAGCATSGPTGSEILRAQSPPSRRAS